MFNLITALNGNSQFKQPYAPPLDHTLQSMIDTVGQILGVDLCVLRGFGTNELADVCWLWCRPNFSSPVPLEQTVWKTNTVVVISNLDKDIPLSSQKAYQKAQICSSLLIPLILDQELIAVFALHQQQARIWQDKEIRLAIMIANQAVSAISQNRAYEKVRAFAQQKALINIITSAIRSSLDPQTIFTAITHQLGQALAVDGCALSLWTKTDEFVQCVGLYDRHSLTQDEPLPQSIVPIAENPVLQQLLETSQPVVLEDMALHPQMNKFDLPLRSPARALLIVPLIVDNEIIGSISLRQIDITRHWTCSEIELAQAVASQAAIAVKQSRLYETTKRQAQQLQESELRVKHLNQYLTESVLKRFLPASIVNKVAAGELVLDLHPETRLVTILFSDIVGFTPLSSQLGSRRVATLLNEYLEAMTEVVFEYGGTVDKFIGDAIFALFGAPEYLSAEEQTKRAIAVARSMHNCLKKLNQRWQDQGLLGGSGPPLVQFRCGIHQGKAVVGMFGGGQRSDYTAIGPTVNIAARLQKAAEANTILISEAVAAYLDPKEINQVRFLTLKGIQDEVPAFSLVV